MSIHLNPGRKILFIMLLLIPALSAFADTPSIATKIAGVSFENRRLNLSIADGRQFRFNFGDDPVLLAKAKGYQANALLALSLGYTVVIYYADTGTEKVLLGLNVVH